MHTTISDYRVEVSSYLVPTGTDDAIHSKNLEKVILIKSEEAEHVFHRIHIDFLGPFKGKIYLIITDAYK